MSINLDDIMQAAIEAKEAQDLAILKQCGWVGNKLIHWECCECDWDFEVGREYER